MKKLITTCCITVGLLLPMGMTSTLMARPFERHPEIHEAIHSLERAKNHLQHAEHDFGGHREAAIHACDAAIHQLQEALAHDRR